jgi:hypothetical protein
MLAGEPRVRYYQRLARKGSPATRDRRAKSISPALSAECDRIREQRGVPIGLVLTVCYGMGLNTGGRPAGADHLWSTDIEDEVDEPTAEARVVALMRNELAESTIAARNRSRNRSPLR